MGPGLYRCDYCTSSYTRTNNLKVHLKKCHGIMTYSFLKLKGSFHCLLCFEKGTKNVMKEHYIRDHNIQLKSSSYTFPDINSFYIWKESIERDTVSFFVKNRGMTALKDGSKVSIYACHRSGFHNSREKRKRKLKASGSVKINGYCPAEIKVKERSDGVTIDYLETHVGHDMELGKLPLSQEERSCIEKKILAGVPFPDILNEIHNSIPQNSLSRIHLISRQDLANIKHSLSLKNESLRLSGEGNKELLINDNFSPDLQHPQSCDDTEAHMINTLSASHVSFDILEDKKREVLDGFRELVDYCLSVEELELINDFDKKIIEINELRNIRTKDNLIKEIEFPFCGNTIIEIPQQPRIIRATIKTVEGEREGLSSLSTLTATFLEPPPLIPFEKYK